MAIRIANIRRPVDEPEAELSDAIERLLGLPRASRLPWRILRKSLDPRDKSNLCFVYTVEVGLPPDIASSTVRERLRGRSEAIVERSDDAAFALPPKGGVPLEHRPVVIGSGPAGLGAAYLLAEQGYCPIVLERGRPVRDRIHDVRAFDSGGPLNPESNYLFGEGGAGTFSDGKLTCRSSGPDVTRILEIFAECKGKPSILYEHRPHLGSNRLPAVVKAMRQRIQSFGGEFRFSCRVEDIDLHDGRLRGLHTSSGYVTASVALLAIGHSARDTYDMLRRRGVPMLQKPFQLGVRIEQPQETVNRVRYGARHWEDELGAADYSLVAHGEHDLFTFCMCAGGQIIPSVSESGYFCSNGMSLSRRASPYANSGLMVTITQDDLASTDIFAGIRLQERYEHHAFELGRRDYLCPIQRASDFLAGRLTSDMPSCSYSRGVVPAPIADVVPPTVVKALMHGLPVLNRRWQGRFLRHATLVGPESRGSSPVRMDRDPSTRECTAIGGLFPIGEGAGYAGGIVSAAVDGLRSAKAIMAKFAPLGTSAIRP